MLYLHCGWPKTGTTSLQAALVANQDRLAEAGVIYPQRWRREIDGSHNDIQELLRSSLEADGAFDGLKDFLGEHAGEDVLLSSESLTFWMLLSEERYEALLGLLAAIQEVTPLRCIWTLRRFDEVIQSVLMQAALKGHRPPLALESSLKQLPLSRMLARMQGIERVVDGDVAYVRYRSSGDHNPELLEAFGLAPDLVDLIGRHLSAAPRLNVSRTQDDRPFVRLEQDSRRDLCERTLASARECAFTPYLRFFDDERVDGTAAPVDPLDSSALPPIVQFWHTEEIPGYIAELLDTVAAQNPDREHLVFDESRAERFIAEHFSAREVSAFRACAVPAMQADYLRYCAVLTLGGVYLDADMRCSASLRSVAAPTEAGRVFRRLAGPRGRPLPHPVVVNGFFAFNSPGHLLLRLALKIATVNIERRIAGDPWVVTGPGIFTSLYLLGSYGSEAEFIERATGKLRRTAKLVCEVAGGPRRAEEAFAELGVGSSVEARTWISHIGASLPYKTTGSHWQNAEGSIFR